MTESDLALADDIMELCGDDRTRAIQRQRIAALIAQVRQERDHFPCSEPDCRKCRAPVVLDSIPVPKREPYVSVLSLYAKCPECGTQCAEIRGVVPEEVGRVRDDAYARGLRDGMERAAVAVESQVGVEVNTQAAYARVIRAAAAPTTEGEA